VVVGGLEAADGVEKGGGEGSLRPRRGPRWLAGWRRVPQLRGLAEGARGGEGRMDKEGRRKKKKMGEKKKMREKNKKGKRRKKKIQGMII